EQGEEQAEQALERVQLTTTGIEPVRNGAGHVAHGLGVWTVGHAQRKPQRALGVRIARRGPDDARAIGDGASCAWQHPPADPTAGGPVDLPVMPPVEPMLAKLARELPRGEMLYEPKWDGFRCLVFRDGDA